MKGGSSKLRSTMAEKREGLLKREEIPDRYRWGLEEIYENDNIWESDYNSIKRKLQSAALYKGRLGDAEALLECLKLRDEVFTITDKLYVYSHMKRDEDNTNSKYQALADRAEGLNTEVNKEFSFVTPEILLIPAGSLEKLIEDKRLSIYKHHINELLRIKEHVLSPDEERIISMAGDIVTVPENIFRMLSSADIKFPTVKNEKDEEVELSEGRYYQMIRSENRTVRKDAFNGLYNTYKKYSNTFAASLNGAVKKDIFSSRVKNYESSIEASLDNDNIPVTVYENIIDTINRNLAPLHRYVSIRKKILGLDKVHMFDLYAPLVKDINTDVPYEEGIELVEKGLQPLGKDYVKILVRGFNSRWIDVYENKGKTHGAYSWGAYGTHPYILLNYTNSLSDVSTIAHEMGHSIHSYLTRNEQPYIYSNYTLFSAEVASTTNEALLIEYLLKTTEDKKKRVFLINQYLEGIRTTVYRQTMFAEFEKIIHEKAENGEALVADLLSSIWNELNTRYYGPDAVVDQEMDIEWARISHFYWDFYVYKYVTGYAAAISLSRKILDEGEAAVARYINFLKKGDSDYSINLLKDAGVDMTTPEPLLNTIKTFEGLLDELEKEIN